MTGPAPAQPSDRPTDLPAGQAPGLPVATVARRLGVAPATLRTWARRYGLGPSGHSAGTHRRYTVEDLQRLEHMQTLVQEGVSPADAARQAAGAQPRDQTNDMSLTGRGGPGGRVLALPGADAVVRGLGRAAMALDAEDVGATIRALLAERGVVPTWEHVLRPVLAASGKRWEATGEGVEVEHLLSDCVTGALRESVPATATAPARPVLLAGAPREQHALPLHVLAAAMAERGVLCRVLGPEMPVGALVASVRRTGAAALFLWAQLPGTGSAAVLEALPVSRPPTVVVAGGPGWDTGALPEGVRHVMSLAAAVEVLLEVVRPVRVAAPARLSSGP